MSLRIHLLGRPRFERGGASVELSSNKAIAMLAYLAVSRAAVSRERVLALLWPGSAEDAARKNLRNTLWTVRRLLGDDSLDISADRIALSGHVWCDVRELERLGEGANQTDSTAIDWPVGSFLDGLHVPDAPDFEIWITQERERFSQRYLRVLSEIANRHRTLGEWARAQYVAQRALAIDPLQEPMHQLVMQAYARLGHRVEALRQYEMLRSTLADELGVLPLAETEALREAIANGAYDQTVVLPTPTAQRRIRRQPMLGDAPRAPFIGRVAQCAALDDVLEQAMQGQSRVVLITGEMGIGKSRLWQEWSANLPQAMTVLETRGLEATQALPFAPLIELFGSSACLKQLLTPSMAVPPIWLAEVARVVPAFHAAVLELPVRAPLPLNEERRQLFEAFAQCFLALNTRPLVLFIDDLHWVDHTTLDFLEYLFHRLKDDGMLLVTTYRPEDAPSALAHLVAGWGRNSVLRRLPLDRLSDDEALALVTALGGDHEQAQRAQKQSAGNPFFLIELCRAGSGDVPLVLSELVRTRLDRLPETSRQVLQAAGVLEPDFDFATLRRTSGRDEEETLDALDALLSASVLVERGGQYRFAHPLVATVVRDGLSSARRAFLHRRAAEAIESAQAAQIDNVAAQLARHYAQARDSPRAAKYADIAADRALALAAPTEAIDLMRQAQALDPSLERQIRLGQALQRTNEINAARLVLESALSSYLERGDRPGATRACLELANVSFSSGRFSDVLRWVGESLRYLDVNSDPRSHVLAHFLLGAGGSQSGGPSQEAETHLIDAVRLATENLIFDLAGQSSFELGTLLAQRGDLASALNAYRDAIRFADRSGDPMQDVLAHNNFAYHALLTGDIVAAHDHIRIALELADTRAIQMPRQYLYSTRGEIALAEEQWEQAELWFNRGMAEAEKAGNTVQTANYRANLGLTAQGRGDLDGALILMEAAYGAASNQLAPYLQIQIDLWLSQLHLVRGERVAAVETLQRAEDRLTGKDYMRLRALANDLRRVLVPQ